MCGWRGSGVFVGGGVGRSGMCVGRSSIYAGVCVEGSGICLCSGICVWGQVYMCVCRSCICVWGIRFMCVAGRYITLLIGGHS